MLPVLFVPLLNNLFVTCLWSLLCRYTVNKAPVDECNRAGESSLALSGIRVEGEGWSWQTAPPSGHERVIKIQE